MFIVRFVARGKKPPFGTARYAGLVTTWEPIKLRGSTENVRGAYVPDDHPDIERIRSTVQGMALTELRSDAEVIRSGAPPAPVIEARAAAIGEAASTMAMLIATTLRNGWGAADVAGVGLAGLPGPDGGRNVRTGLSLAELSLTRPPLDWSTLAAAGRPPWESVDWAPPGPGWVHPAWPDPVKPDEDAPSAPPVDTDTDTDTDQQPEPATAAPAPAAEVVPEPSRPVVDPDDANDPLASYADQEALPQVRELLMQLWEKKGGGKVHPNAINFILTRQDPPLPPLNGKQIEAILADHTTTS